MTTETVPSAEQPDQRAEFAAGLREFADWIEARPWAPITRSTGYSQRVRLQIDLYEAAGYAETLAIADELGAKIQDHLEDRTSVEVVVGSAEYTVIAWHRNGRPGEREAELERLRAEVEQLRAAAAQSVWCGGDCTLLADHAGEHDIRDNIGLAYSREPEDDPTPVSPARVPLHTGSVVQGDELIVDGPQ